MTTARTISFSTRDTMKLSRVVLTVLLAACSLLSFACGSDSQCQATTIGTDAGSTPTCASTGTTVQACCNSNHAVGNTDPGQCKYVVEVPGAQDKVFACDDANCVAAVQDLKSFCGAP